jgi:hypothetical protein
MKSGFIWVPDKNTGALLVCKGPEFRLRSRQDPGNFILQKRRVDKWISHWLFANKGLEMPSLSRFEHLSKNTGSAGEAISPGNCAASGAGDKTTGPSKTRFAESSYANSRIEDT